MILYIVHRCPNQASKGTISYRLATFDTKYVKTSQPVETGVRKKCVLGTSPIFPTLPRLNPEINYHSFM